MDPVAIENVTPEIECGRFPAKIVVNSKFTVTAEVFRAGHDLVYPVLMYRKLKKRWRSVAMKGTGNDLYEASFTPDEPGIYEYKISAWKDSYGTLIRNINAWLGSNEDVEQDLIEAINLIKDAYKRSSGNDKKIIKRYLDDLINSDLNKKVMILNDNNFSSIIKKYQKKIDKTDYRTLRLIADPEYGGYGSWYELFPRSIGNFNDIIKHLNYVKSMNFNVLYLTPIHPIGITNRRGKNGSRISDKNDPGSPWAIGNDSGGHYSINSDLGSLEDFKNLLRSAREKNIMIAMDIALQCSPDHPYVRDHPEWFYHRPDGSIRYAENPPKKYYDIYPLNFETKNKMALWNEMKNIFLYWISNGVKIFRVDNPHTKPLDFWEWLINDIKRDHPDVVFLSEAFTRENLMFELSKRGFTMSYTYFTWKLTKGEITEYFKKLYSYPYNFFFRPMLFTNTPDILGRDLSMGRNEFIIRSVLASTLSSLWGIYSGFELCENDRLDDTEEYLNSEKYEIKRRNFNSDNNIKDIIARLNSIRDEMPALRSGKIKFCETDNDKIIAYARYNNENKILVVLNLDTMNVQSGFIRVPLNDFSMDLNSIYDVHDVLNNNHYKWSGEYNYVRLIPGKRQAHIMVIKNA
ncbi:alpha-1,4-glucan--maltose-1-phosphate maltosyltransferase [Picrophilus oshimae]|uniref:Alpha-1,4-glucan:maltose-1-phosphate maltosyltransferase n=1 Tax=Picrophilus torridus (strain ATCC 700027 / DSM 9790 / JCM 10055 / NBRC 100828 / KAW 2/3) TaxID=1122961 RepID=GLGE_PICTO|nr:alpha-1,4-glucan--maltose-1-phosphate maltosyltransferase [Picrophilus oshimae]Q6L2Z8.1 RecName: Full=Alpha-1,4-glucan:maltose-1-phosphate maltosyltransferase; Short=GMPMT; AltName: Full=(1->4)-alpha-D-glucan:maltose-1-phosphate alpha-D-maltosyltransferase [Picrophilus oshimae DSM 9789]AAT42653.1 1,4-alpha-glucan branching enzyme [Picrophilus oshimae DSM 9789]